MPINIAVTKQLFEAHRYPNANRKTLEWNKGRARYRNDRIQIEFTIWCQAIEATGVGALVDLIGGIVVDMRAAGSLTPERQVHADAVLDVVKEIFHGD